jgi:3-oxoacid CoA-transferase B subunit
MSKTEMDAKEKIARRIARFFVKNDVVNLGIGIPCMASEYMEDGVMVQSENGLLGVGKPSNGLWKVESYCNAAGDEVTVVPGVCCFDIATSFGMIRKGCLTATVLGCLQVAANGDIANWRMPGKSPGMGGAMDLVCGVEKVIVATLHTTKDGQPKILKECTLPLTGRGVVNWIVTELALFEVTPDGLLLREISEGTSLEEIRSKTEAPFTVYENLKVMNI